MASSLDVIALISGGKDSLYSILHCLKHGHRIVALANLHPPASLSATHDGTGQDLGEEDMDSFLYQTVGHSFIPLYAEALDLPLYRAAIAGTAVQIGRDYDSSFSERSPDETEDLFHLLQKVKEHHPSANALCSGAILSTYQRTRIESVAVRLGLTPLAYLWQYPVLPPAPGHTDSITGLLNDMDAAGCDARIIKLASGGLGESMLWSNVADVRTRNQLLAQMPPFFPSHELWQSGASMRGALLGEGGEYETLAINGPPFLWKKRIHVDRNQIDTFSGGGGTHYARVSSAKLIENGTSFSEATNRDIVRQPALLDLQFSRILDLHRSQPVLSADPAQTPKRRARLLPTCNAELVHIGLGPSEISSSSHLALANETAPEAGSDVAKQMESIVKTVKRKLRNHHGGSASTSDVIASVLLLSDMDDFTAVNAIYSTLLTSGKPNPPARVTIAADLPPNVKVSLSLVLEIGKRKRGLHVQSRSYWAPANIGPYSQAVCEPLLSTSAQDDINDSNLSEVVHLAGQIPLVPHTMELLNQCFCYQAILSLQHLWRVAQERCVDLLPWLVAFVPTNRDTVARADIADWVRRQAYKPFKTLQSTDDDEDDEDDEDVDVWNQQFNRRHPGTGKLKASNAGAHLHLLPNPNVSDFAPPLLVAEVVSLPRNASIEWWSTGLAGLAAPTGQQRLYLSSNILQTDLTGSLGTLRYAADGYAVCISTGHDASEGKKETTTFVTVFIPTSQTSLEDEVRKILAANGLEMEGAHQLVSGTAFVAGDSQQEDLSWAKGIARVACKSLWGSAGNQFGVGPLQAALLLRLENQNLGNEGCRQYQ